MGADRRLIRRMKAAHYNIYGLSDGLFVLLFFGIAALAVFCLLQELLRGQPAVLQLVLLAVLEAVFLTAGFLRIRQGSKKAVAYHSKDGYEFLGLYDLSGESQAGESLLNRSDVLPRNAEADYIHSVLENIVFPQNSLKQALCLTGKSGSGKSTILAFLKQLHHNDYHIIDYAGNYENLESDFCRLLSVGSGDDLLSAVNALVRRGRVLFVLDQFERYFQLRPDQKAAARQVISILGRRDTALILTMREEYYADFMKEFDMNNLKLSTQARDIKGGRGILKDLVSIIREKNGLWQGADSRRPSITVGSERIKNHLPAHLPGTTAPGERTVLEPTGITLFYCENQNELTGDQRSSTELSREIPEKLNHFLRPDLGAALMDKHGQEPLIAQQILFHMIESEKKERHLSDVQLEASCLGETGELLTTYFDTQLASVSDYSLASRVLYLLSQARIHHVSLPREDLERALALPVFFKGNNGALSQTLQELCSLQLIRRSGKNTDRLYEIAHDFIAQEFNTYAHASMNRAVRGALDNYMSEYLDPRKRALHPERDAFEYRASKSPFYLVFAVICFALMLAAELCLRFVWNPWLDPWKALDAFGGYHPLYPFVISAASLVYLYQIYAKFIRYYRGNRRGLANGLYILITLLGVCAAVAYPHFLALDGAALSIAGFLCSFLLEEGYPEASRAAMRYYGLRSAFMGAALCLAHLLLWRNSPVLPSYLIFVESLIFGLLVGYAFLSHMTAEYLYGKYMDATSQKAAIG